MNGPFGRTMVVLAVVLLGIGARQVEAQVPDPPPADADTIPGDVIEVPIPAEAITTDTVPDAVSDAAAAPTPPVAVPRLPAFGTVGWDVARWEWSAADLARLPGMTLLEFVERIPGVTGFRLGGFGRPEGLTAMGMGGARLRVFLDGFELDPHVGGSYPIEMLSIVDARRIRVERTLSAINVHVDTYVLDEPEPASLVALGTGVYQTRTLRTLVSRGFGTRSVGTVVFDLASTAGIGVNERYRHLNAVARWDFVPSEGYGLQFEWRRTIADRAGTVAPLATTRGDVMLRARAAPSERLVAEAFLGRSRTDEDLDPMAPGDVSVAQGGARVGYATERMMAEVGVRGRAASEGPLPAAGFETEARLGLRPLSAIRLETVANLSSAGDVSARMARATASVHPAPFVSLFATIETGSRLVPIIVSRPVAEEEQPIHEFERIVTDAGGLRGGLEFAGRFGTVGFATFRSAATDIAPFGLAFDRGWMPAPAAEATGVETHFRLPVPGARRFVVDGWYTRYFDPPERLYAPNEIGRVGVSFHGLYFGGQLEPSFRLEGLHRAATLVPAAPETDIVQVMPGFQTLNFAFHLRIIDVTAFLLWDNLLVSQEAVSLPGAPPAFPRIAYGGSWRFRN